MNGRGIGDSEKPNGVAAARVEGGEAAPDSKNRRVAERVDVLWSVDCETEDTFLYAAITNISEMGIFVRTTDPLAVGTSVTLRFAPVHVGVHACGPSSAPKAPAEPFMLTGVVQWVNRVRPRADNPNPGMGIRFITLTLPDRERIVETIRTIAYLREEPRSRGSQDSSN